MLSQAPISVVSSQAWVYSRLSKADDLAVQLQSLNVDFEFWLSGQLRIIFKRFGSARRFAICLNLCRGFESRLGWQLPVRLLMKVCETFDWGVIEREFLGSSPSDVVLSDIYVFSSTLESRDLEFLELCGRGKFMSLFHGTYLLEESNPLVHRQLLSGFRSVTAFATGPAQARSYVRDYGDLCRIEEIRPPRFESQTNDAGAASTQELTLLFLLRNPMEFSDFSLFQAVFSLIDVIRAAGSTTAISVALKPHPNQSKLQVGFIFTATKLWSLVAGHRVYRTHSLHKYLDNPNVIAASWFSGVLLDFVSRDQLAFEIRAGKGIRGPKSKERTEWDAMWKAGLIERATTKEEITDLISRGTNNPSPAVRSMLSKYFFETPCSTRLVALEVLRRLGPSDLGACAGGRG